MTTRVTIDPANHDIEVIITENGEVATRDLLAPGEPPRAYHIYGDRALVVREVKLVKVTGSAGGHGG